MLVDEASMIVCDQERAARRVLGKTAPGTSRHYLTFDVESPITLRGHHTYRARDQAQREMRRMKRCLTPFPPFPLPPRGGRRRRLAIRRGRGRLLGTRRGIGLDQAEVLA